MATNLDSALPLADAARRLNISYGTVHKRLQRGHLTGIKRGGRWYVFLDELDKRPDGDSPHLDNGIDQAGPPPDAQHDTNQTNLDSNPDALIAALQADVEFLRAEVVRKDHIIAAMTNALANRLLELPASASPSPATPPPQRSWWQRLFGIA